MKKIKKLYSMTLIVFAVLSFVTLSVSSVLTQAAAESDISLNTSCRSDLIISGCYPFGEAEHTVHTVYTPFGTAVAVKTYIEEHDNFEINSINASYGSAYPSAVRLRDPTVKYNCHSYAWYSQSESNTMWIPDPQAYYEDGSYYEVTYPQVVYILGYFNNGEITHSAIIVDIDSDYGGLGSITVESKWGSSGLYRHRADYCPYMSGLSYTKIFAPHTHNYTDHYVKHSDTQHKAYCSCGQYRLATHVISPSDTNKKYAKCVHCKAMVDTSKINVGVLKDPTDEYIL